MPNPNSEKTEQKKSFTIPSHIEFTKDSERILRWTLLAVTPQEGCALLIGESLELHSDEKPNVFKIQLIWPCCNIWRSGFHDNSYTYLETNGKQPKKFSKENRFLLDPNEQFSAQKWARSKNLKILGTAHSHPIGAAIPSITDLELSYLPNLMIILSGQTKELKAWWVNYPEQTHPAQIPLINANQQQ